MDVYEGASTIVRMVDGTTDNFP